MGDGLFKKINQYFNNRDYEKIPTDSDTVSMYGVFDKSNLYLINVIELRDGYGLDPERYLEYKQMTMQQFMGNQADKIILLNVILADETDSLMEAFNYVPDMSEQFIDVIWFVNKSTEQLVIPKKQLNSVLGIQKDLKRLIRNEDTSYYELKPTGRLPLLTTLFFLVNVLVWLYMEYTGSSTETETLLNMGALYTPYVIEGREYLRLIQSMFLHIGFLHLFHNMFGLYIFGYRLERYLGRLQFLIVYLGAGIIGSAVSIGADVVLGRVVIAAGASGAVYGLMGSLLVVSRIVKKPIDGVTTYVVWAMFALGIVHSIMTPGVSLSAHLGGFIGGILMTLLVLKTSKKIDAQT